jgi:hypothetical protein
MKFENLRKGQIIHVEVKGQWNEFFLILSKPILSKLKNKVFPALSYDFSGIKARAARFSIMGEEEWRVHFGNAEFATEKEKQKLENMNWLSFFIKNIFDDPEDWKSFMYWRKRI